MTEPKRCPTCHAPLMLDASGGEMKVPCYQHDSYDRRCSSCVEMNKPSARPAPAPAEGAFKQLVNVRPDPARETRRFPPIEAPAEGAELFRQQAKELAELCEKLRPGTGAAIETFVNMAYEEGAEPRYDLLTDWRDLADKNLETAQRALKVIDERDKTIASLREQLAQAQRHINYLVNVIATGPPARTSEEAE